MPEYTYRVAPHDHQFNLFEDNLQLHDLTDTISQVSIEQLSYISGRPVPYRFDQVKSGYDLVFTATRYPLDLWSRIKTWFGKPPAPMVVMRINTQTAQGKVEFKSPEVIPFEILLKVELENLNRRKSL